MGYITGRIIRELREKKSMTQKDLVDQLSISDKTVSKWETDRGMPDIGILNELAQALGASVADLFSGEYQENENKSGNMKKLHFYVCPVCGNVITALGRGSFTCCGIHLPELEVETDINEEHRPIVETIDNEYYVTMSHEMTKNHYISFIAYITSDTAEVTKLYAEQDISVRYRKKGHGYLYAYCNRHGLFRINV